MEDRSFQEADYRYGFGGHEKDDEIKGNGKHYDFGGYGYDPILGRRWNVDPEFKQIAGLSPYSYSLKNPIVYKDPDGKLPILPLLLKAGANGATDMLTQAAIAYFFDPNVETINQAFEVVNWWQVSRSAAEGAMPWKVPGGKFGKAAATASGDVLVNALSAGSNYSKEQALQDFATGFVSNLAGDALGELISKYGSGIVAKGLSKMGFDDKAIEKYITGAGTTWKGRADYSDLDLNDKKAHIRGIGKKFTEDQKNKVKAVNKKHNNGYLRDDETGDFLVPGVRGGKDPFQAEVDHIVPKRGNPQGTNHFSNAQGIGKKRNGEYINKQKK
ncbi:RHS repeat-associated core domain-containing protein [Flammeovirga aprica]|uniref:Uncharacterized protein n=1 Tax=Flammeovirga aprica JL-4 TaxID=694437 RepID=A0A7X9P2R9_9BACT|nr:hypothetical protein [Flammeovirga aprica]NME68496.1 hypothetical protein [Flammeovirga aprica JL-4]